ncbi:protein kinase, partial [Candidatus Nephthysia bennettiae]|uniref:protein kinase n=1 Tax=Candidatus Nephthysia bennettiae TaxID=3127016 RepID=UPI0030C7429A
MLHFAHVRNKVSTTLVANPTSEHGFAVVRDAVTRRLTPLQLEELLGRGAHGDTWRARLADGSRVAVKRMSSVGEDPSAFFQRLEKASGVHHANLLEVIRALEETGEFWVVSRLGTGVPLNTLLKGSRLRSGCAVAVGMGILSGLTALHQAGLWHGSVHGRNVHVDLDGSVKLGDHCLSPAPAGQSSAALRAADVRAAGALICTMLRVPLENAPPAGQRQALKMASSPLGLAAKAIAGPPRKLPAGYEAAHASLTLWEAARKMATSRRQAQARHDLATMVMAALGAPRPTVVQTRDRQESERSRRSAPGTSSAPATQAAASASAEA